MVAAACVAGALLIGGAAGRIFFKDGGELSAAALSMGVPHPTGFAVWTGLARVCSLLPLGPLPVRIALASALPMALTIALLAHLVGRPLRRLGPAPGPAADLLLRGFALPVLVLASETVWVLSTTPEVYALSALLTFGLLAACLAPGGPALRARFALAGLVPAVHVNAGIGLVGLLARRGPGEHGAREAPARRSWLTGAFLFLLTSGSVLALWAAAGRGAELDFGHPAGIGRLVDHLTGASIRQAFADPATKPGLTEAVAEHTRLLLTDLGPALLLSALVGAFAYRKTGVGRALTGLFVLDLLYAVLVNPMGRVDLQTGLVAVLSCAGLAVLGAVRLGAILPGLGRAGALLLGAVLLLSRAPALGTDLPNRVALRDDPSAARLTRAALAPLPPGTVAFTSSDDLIGSLLAARSLDGLRPDVIQVVTPYIWWPWRVDLLEGLPGAAPLQAEVRAASPDGRAPSDRAQVALARAWLKWAHQRRHAVWEVGAGPLDAALGSWVHPGAPLCWVDRDPPPLHRWPDPQMVAAEVVAGQPRPRHAWSRRAVSDSLRLASLAATRQSRAVEALMWLESAVEIDPENGRAWHNLGVSYLRDRRAVEAIVALDRAVLLRPFDSRAWRNLGLAAREAGRPDRSATAFERALSTARNEHQRERALQLRGEK